MIYVIIFVLIALGVLFALALCKIGAESDEQIAKMIEEELKKLRRRMNEEMKKRCDTSTNKEN